MTENPRAIREILLQEERTEAALEKATTPLPAKSVDGEDPPGTAAQAFTERMAEQRREEDKREARVNRLMHEHPAVPLDTPDPLRTHFANRGASKRRLRRGGLVP